MSCAKRHGLSGGNRVVLAVLTMLMAGCSKPGEVISSRITLANQNLEAGRTDEAIEILEKLDRRYPDHASIEEALGFAYARAGRNADAAASFVHAADRDPGSVSLRQLAAEAYFRAGSLDRAAEQNRLYLGEFPKDFQSWQRLGEIEERRGDVKRAIEAYLEWYRLRPSGEAAFRLGRAFRSINNAPQAKSWFEETIKRGEVHIDEALLGLLELEIYSGDYAAAERTVHQLDRVFPGALNASPLAGVRERIAAWKENQEALERARQGQRQLVDELKKMREPSPETASAPTTPPPAPPATSKPAAAPPPAASSASTTTTASTSSAAPESNAGTEAPPPATSAPPAPSEREPAVAVASTPEANASEPPPTTPSIATQPMAAPPAEAPPLLREAIERRRAGDLPGAIQLLWEAVAKDDGRVPIWMELADCFREQKRFPDAEACLLEARRRAPESIEVETAYLNLVHETQPAEVYLSRLQSAREKFPADPNLAWAQAHELTASAGPAERTIAAYEDFLLLADPGDPRREEAAAFLARAGRR